MAAIITEKFRVHNAKQFKEDFGESASSTYVFIGRSHPWPTDTSPPTPVNGTSETVDAWSDMTALKKVGSADVSHGLTRYDWTSGVTYDEYAHDISATNTSSGSSATSLFASKFYVMTDEYHVYKCLRTGRATGGATVASTVKPVGTSATDLVSTSDTGATMYGYLWKYMYTVTASDTIKFVTNDFIPVKTLGVKNEIFPFGVSSPGDDGSSQWDVENNAVNGGVHHAIVTAKGSGYTNGDGAYEGVPIVGDGSGGVCTVHVSGNQVTHITVTAPGTGYRNAQVIIATTTTGLSGIGGGSGAVVKCIISPQIGHGADPVTELGGNHVIVNSRLEFGEGSGDFPTDNDFRRIGLIKNPVQSSDGTVSSATSMTATNQLTVADASTISVDDLLTDAASEGAATAKVRVVSKTTNVLKTLPVVNSGGEYVAFANSDEVFVNGAGTKATDVGGSGVATAHPEMTRFTGQILYVENRGAVSRAADQIEDIKLIIEM